MRKGQLINFFCIFFGIISTSAPSELPSPKIPESSREESFTLAHSSARQAKFTKDQSLKLARFKWGDTSMTSNENHSVNRNQNYHQDWESLKRRIGKNDLNSSQNLTHWESSKYQAVSFSKQSFILAFQFHHQLLFFLSLSKKSQMLVCLAANVGWA